MMGQTGLLLSNNKFTHKCILSSKSLLTYHFSHGHNFSYLCHIGLKLYPHLNESCIYVSKYYIDMLHHLKNIVNLLHHTFFVLFCFLRHPVCLYLIHAKFYQCKLHHISSFSELVHLVSILKIGFFIYCILSTV